MSRVIAFVFAIVLGTALTSSCGIVLGTVCVAGACSAEEEQSLFADPGGLLILTGAAGGGGSSGDAGDGDSSGNGSGSGGGDLPGLFIVGFSNDSSNVPVPGYWHDDIWNELPRLDVTKSGWARDVATSGTDLYIAGDTIDSSNLRVAGYWLNGTWVALPPLETGKNCWAHAIKINGSDIVVGGSCSNSMTNERGVIWTNGVVTALSTLSAVHSTRVISLTIAGGSVYAAGFTGSATTVTARPTYWKDGVRTDLATVSDEAHWVYGLALSGSDVVTVGFARNADSAAQGARWTNTASPHIYTPYETYAHSPYVSPCTATGIVVDGGDLKISGYCRNAADFRNIPLYWVNNTRNELPRSDVTRHAYANDIFISGGDVYVTGYESIVPNTPVYWLNGVRTTLPTIDATRNSETYRVLKN